MVCLLNILKTPIFVTSILVDNKHDISIEQIINDE